MIIINIVLTL